MGGDCRSTANTSDVSSLDGSYNDFDNDLFLLNDDDKSVPKRNAKYCAGEFCAQNGKW